MRHTSISGIFFLAGIASSLVAAPPLVRASLYLSAIVIGGVRLLAAESAM